MAKELNTWLDEFVEGGADPKNVGNWPKSDLGSVSAATGIDVYNLWVDYFKMLDEELAKRPDCNEYRLILSADKLLAFLEKCGVDTSTQLVNGSLCRLRLNSGLNGFDTHSMSGDYWLKMKQAYPLSMQIDSGDSSNYVSVNVLGGIVEPYLGGPSIANLATIEEAINYYFGDHTVITQFQKNPLYIIRQNIDNDYIVGTAFLEYLDAADVAREIHMLSYDFKEFLSLFDVEYYYKSPGR